MTWYAAHLVMFVKLKAKRQTRYPVWENIVLIQARTENEAFEKAEQRGREGEGDDNGTFRWGNEPAAWIFAGVRKLTLCVDPETRPGDGTEVTYAELIADSKEALEKFAAGAPVRMQFNDRFAESAEAADGEAKKPTRRKSKTA